MSDTTQKATCPITVKLPNGEVRYSYTEALDRIEMNMAQDDKLYAELQELRQRVSNLTQTRNELRASDNLLREAFARHVLCGTGFEPAKVK